LPKQQQKKTISSEALCFPVAIKNKCTSWSQYYVSIFVSIEGLNIRKSTEHYKNRIYQCASQIVIARTVYGTSVSFIHVCGYMYLGCVCVCVCVWLALQCKIHSYCGYNF
jgi:hypothetical protein